MIQKIFVLLGSQKALAYSEMVMIQRSDTPAIERYRISFSIFIAAGN